LVDEASAIPDAILDNIESGLSGEYIFVAYMANPTRPRGRFRETFQGERAKRWLTYNIDARTVDIVHRAHIQELLDDCNGDIEASSFRINVRGLFALVDYDQTIPQYLIDAACVRQAIWDDRAPIVIGADIARKGENKTVFLVRQRGTILEIQVFAKLEVDLAADYLIGIIQRYTRVVHGRVVAPDCFCDADGVGAGVVDCCTRQGYHVEEVRSALPAVAHQRYANRRAEMWFWARDWVKNEGCFDKTERWVEELLDQLGSVTYHRDNLDRIIIEPKESMLVSPDLADAFVYSFAEPRMLQAATW
jgi:hypothetical protein